MTRIPTPRAGELRADASELLALITPPDREPPRTMTTLARQPELLAPFLGWAAALALKGVIAKREHEILALRVAWNCRSEFEWGEHAAYARAAGLTDEEIAAIVGSITDGQWSGAEIALLHVADELCDESSVSDATWSALASHFDAAQLVEIVMIAGQYTMLSMLANATGITLPDGLDPLPSA